MHEIVSQPRPVEWQVERESRVVARVTIEDVLLGHTTPSFACATMDWWPRSKCDYGTCSWGAAGPAVSMPTVNLRYVDTSTCPGSSFVVLSSALSAAPTGMGGLHSSPDEQDAFVSDGCQNILGTVALEHTDNVFFHRTAHTTGL